MGTATRIENESEKLDSFRVALMNALDGEKDPVAIEGNACFALATWLDTDIAVYGEVIDDGKSIVHRRDYHKAGTTSQASGPVTADFGSYLKPLLAGRVMAIADVESDPAYDEAARAGWRALGCRSSLHVPLVEDGKTLAYVAVGGSAPRHWTDAEILILREAASRTHEAIRRARTENAQRESEQRLRIDQAWLATQNEALRVAMDGKPLEVSLGILTRAAIAQLDGGCRSAFYVANAATTKLRHVVGMPETYATAVNDFEVSPESFSCGLAVATGQPVITADVLSEPRWQAWSWLAREHRFRGCWSFPVETATGALVASFAMYFPEPREPTPRVRELVATLSKTAALIISSSEQVQAWRKTW